MKHTSIQIDIIVAGIVIELILIYHAIIGLLLIPTGLTTDASCKYSQLCMCGDSIWLM